MQITLNGKAYNTKGAATVDALMQQLELDVEAIAVERNAAIVPRVCYAETLLSDGDQIEIVRFVGGG